MSYYMQHGSLHNIIYVKYLINTDQNAFEGLFEEGD